jgi:hypothetical protein|tara:strand:- start:27087 stop:27290 length:204 start_codon:yes stop_codon:yes gene_type:complete
MKKKLRINKVEPSRPDSNSLSSRAKMGLASGDGKNKSVWQSMVDSSGFAKRHPDIMLGDKTKPKRSR